MSGVAENIAGSDIGAPFTQSRLALPGTDFMQVSERGYHATALALRNVCARLLEVADITKGTADDYDVTESDYVAALSIVDLPR